MKLAEASSSAAVDSCTAGRKQGLWAAYCRRLGAVDRFINKVLGKFGAFVARRPVPVLATALLLSLVLSAGFVRVVDLLENYSLRLWCALPSPSQCTRAV